MKLTDEEIAIVAHEANRAFCDIDPESETTGQTWASAPAEIKRSAINYVKVLRFLPDREPEYIHDVWYQEKIKQGWKLGNELSFDGKTHPCLKPYRKLSDHQKRKDNLFAAVVKALTDEI